jgi:hypothetical protein
MSRGNPPRAPGLAPAAVRRIVRDMAATSDPDESLKRLGGGRWQTRDERFTIEPQSGTWVVVDAEQTDDLGLALVRGPFGSLGAAKAAIAEARAAEPATSPLASRVAQAGTHPSGSGTRSSTSGKGGTSRKAAPVTGSDDGTPGTTAGKTAKPSKATPAPEEPAAPGAPEPPPEPRWMRDLEPADRRRARRLIEALTDAGARDPEGVVRRDLVGDVPTVAAFAVGRALKALGSDASPAAVAMLLAGDRDEALGVRWRLVDGDDRPITIDVDDLDA